VYLVTNNTQSVVNIDMLPQIQEQSAKITVERILSHLSKTVEAMARIQRNLNRRMVVENLLLNAVEEC
jgi:hypothetical protein